MIYFLKANKSMDFLQEIGIDVEKINNDGGGRRGIH
jgi:hypothetical protein